MTVTVRPVTVMPDAVAARSLVGPFAWVVFEDMASRTTGSDGPVVVAESVRSVAGRLSFSKDTVARALTRLIDSGLVEPLVERTGSSGRFGPARYRLHLDRAGVMVPADTTSATSAKGRPAADAAKPARARREDGDQLTLLPLGGD